MEVIVAFDATFESMIFDARHGVGDGDGGQASAMSESIVSDAHHGVGDGDGGQAAATLECIKR